MNYKSMSRISFVVLSGVLFASIQGQYPVKAQSQDNSQDTQFAQEAASGGMTEVKLGQLAQQNASSAEVKAFGERMVTDHSKANAELKRVAAKEGITLPTQMSEKDQATCDQLSQLKGDQFDQAYTKAMLKDHEKDVSDFEQEASSGSNDAVKQFATRTLPTLKEHLEMIKKVSGAMTINTPAS